MAKRDNEELVRILETHSVEGYPIHHPLFDDAFIIRQEGTGPTRRYTDTGTELGSPQIVYVTRPAREFSFDEWVKKRGLGTNPMTYKEWIDKYGKRTRMQVLPMTAELREELEAGRSVSEAEAEYSLIKYGGCLGPDETVICNSVFAKDVYIPPGKLKKGMLVEVNGPPDFYGAGRVVGFGKNKEVVLVELFTPVSYFSATDAMANEEVRPGFYSAHTYSIGYGTRQAMEDNNIPLPPGKFLDAKEREYILNDLMEISEVQKICDKFHPDEPHCLLQSLIFYILPLHTTGRYAATFHPLPEKFLTSEYVVSYD